MSDIRDAARRHLIPHFTKAEAWQSPQLPVYVRGDGAYLWDDAGRQVLDGLSGRSEGSRSAMASGSVSILTR